MMAVDSELLSFMDLLDFDEEIIDKRVKTILERRIVSHKNYKDLINLLQYKYLINTQEGTECDISQEIMFIVKLFPIINTENIDNICKIIELVLSLCPSRLQGLAEHLLQQILSEIDSVEKYEDKQPLFYLKLCNSILNAAICNKIKVSLLCLDIPLEMVLYKSSEEINNYFVACLLPNIIDGVVDYNILDNIWQSFNEFEDTDHKEIILKTLTSLSEYFLPLPYKNHELNKNSKHKSKVIQQHLFWNLVLFGLNSNSSTLRKSSIYLAKRAIDVCLMRQYRFIIKNENNEDIFQWNTDNEVHFKTIWYNYFVLLETLEEKQSNIVLPSLQLFDTIKDIGVCWLDCIFNIGLKHDNLNVRQKCIYLKFTYPIARAEQARVLLEALNDNNLYECPVELREKLKEFLQVELNQNNILRMLPLVKLSVIPLYHLTDVLSTLNSEHLFPFDDKNELINIICNILQNPCNNVIIRQAIQCNVLNLTLKLNKNNWEGVSKVVTKLQCDIFKIKQIRVCLQVWLQNCIFTNEDEKLQFLTSITSSFIHLDFVILYINANISELKKFGKILTMKLETIQNIVNRQYSDRMDCFDDFIYVAHLIKKSSQLKKPQASYLLSKIFYQFDILIHYIKSLISNKTDWDVEQLGLFSQSCEIVLQLDNNLLALLDLYKIFKTDLVDNTWCSSQKLLGLFLFNILTQNIHLYSQYKHEMMGLEAFLNLISIVTSSNTKSNESLSKCHNRIYESICETVHHIIYHKEGVLSGENLKLTVDFLEHVIECGGYDCLKWVLRIVNILLPNLIQSGDSAFDIVKFIDRSWKEIEELKSNNQFAICMKEFIVIITNDSLLNKPECIDILKCYGLKILEYGSVSNTPLFYLTENIKKLAFTMKIDPLLDVISEILLFCPVSRKDQRITDNVVSTILAGDGEITNENYHFNYEIQNIGVSMLLTIKQDGLFGKILTNIKAKLDAMFRNKKRYHLNSQAHRLILRAMEHIIFITFVCSNQVDVEETVVWCINLLSKLPHESSVKFYMEWIIALYFCSQKNQLNVKTLQKINFKDIPITSQLMILDLYMTCTLYQRLEIEYEFVMDYLLGHTMGQIFNTRLLAQYTALKLYKMAPELHTRSRYDYTIQIIERTFEENRLDKSFKKIQDDFLVNRFDIIKYLNPAFIYYHLPRYFDVAAGEVTGVVALPTAEDCREYMKRNDGVNTRLHELWLDLVKEDNVEDAPVFKQRKTEVQGIETEPSDLMGAFQKKYVPWRNMDDIAVCNIGKKVENRSELVVVASLIDKLPNLGGMARTSEVFGVKTYIVDSLRHMQDKQFQGLSVSAEKWVDMEEVRPGRALKDYLMNKKNEGYRLIAAEQTSSSVPLQTFKFPLKTVLLLGHEKMGVPCDLLPLMDDCVEIPQRGYVRSLNVHVAAAIFVWEYVRQNVL